MLAESGGDWEIRALRVDSPRQGEILVRLACAGLCYSDEHLRHDKGTRLPIVGGHEGPGR
ncbi:MAG TPA: alcohol dehydrogenase catalytic domain-containing protein [Streptosporangiaceae bacterium]|nr:alcohol dehydrogenase catalytic domain-containing protein [Streptosporangiaceae bacterium]